MFQFNELNEVAQAKAIKGFQEAFKKEMGISVKREVAKGFLSKSKVHRYNEEGQVIAKVRKVRGQEQLAYGNVY